MATAETTKYAVSLSLKGSPVANAAVRAASPQQAIEKYVAQQTAKVEDTIEHVSSDHNKHVYRLVTPIAEEDKGPYQRRGDLTDGLFVTMATVKVHPLQD